MLHIAAQDVDSRAQAELERLGYKVVVWRVYAARPVSDLTVQASRLLEQGKFDAVVVFSARTAEALKALLEQRGLQACCESLSAIGLSWAVADVLRPLPWRELVIASSPTEDAVIECLKRLYL